jgi:hypothetical protein
MPSHKSHGRAYLEPERHDELSSGVPACVVPVPAGGQERSAGQYVPGSAETVANAAKGGAAKRGRTRLSHVIEGEKLTPTSRTRARTLRRALSGEIASTVGGGVCGIAASLFLKFAAQKTAAAEEAFERGDYEAHRKLTESARMDILYGREHAAKEAEARRKTSPRRGWGATAEVKP